MQPFHYRFHDYFSDRYNPDSLRFASFLAFCGELATTSTAFALLRFALFCSKLATTLSAFAAFCGVLRETVLRQIDQN
jgi:hypothetical protein